MVLAQHIELSLVKQILKTFLENNEETPRIQMLLLILQS